jgi:hypothetical protein
LREVFGYESPIALLQALDVQELLGERPHLGAAAQELRDRFGGHGTMGGIG